MKTISYEEMNRRMEEGYKVFENAIYSSISNKSIVEVYYNALKKCYTVGLEGERKDSSLVVKYNATGDNLEIRSIVGRDPHCKAELPDNFNFPYFFFKLELKENKKVLENIANLYRSR